jgi:hypothetical protein
MAHDVGIWIDHEKAVIVRASAGSTTSETVESEVGGHPRFGGALVDGGEKKYEERHGQNLDRYFDAVIDQLAGPERLLIFGPGEAKRELERRFRHSKSHAGCVVDVETADKLTDSQVVARVKEYFGIER